MNAEEEMPNLQPLPVSWNKANKVIGKFGVEGEEEKNDRKDNKQAEGGDSDKEGEEANLHNIALARRIIHDNLCTEVFTSADAERIVLGCCDEDDADQIDNDIGVCSGLIGAPEGWLAPTPPPTFSGYVYPSTMHWRRRLCGRLEYVYFHPSVLQQQVQTPLLSNRSESCPCRPNWEAMPQRLGIPLPILEG